MRKQVFLSSVFRSLADVRRRIHDELLRQGYDVWWAEDHPELRSAPPEVVRAVCIHGIEASDIYLGIFPGRYGSDPLGLAFTELEYHYAVSIGLPRLLYILQDRRFVSDDQRTKQKGFLHLVRDSDLSEICPTRVSSISHLLSRLQLDFESLRNNPEVTGFEPWQAPCLRTISASTAALVAINDLPELSAHEAAHFLGTRLKESLPEAAVLGLAFAQRFFQNPDWRDWLFLRGLDEFLAVWTYIAAWVGVRGPLGQTSISKARIVLTQMLNAGSRVYDLAGAVASGFYADRHIKAARKWYEVAHRFSPSNSLLGSIDLAEGDVQSAKSRFLEILIAPTLDVNNYGLHLAHYAFCLVKEGRQRDGLRHTREATQLANLTPTTLTRIYRSAAETYLHLGDFDSALDLVEHGASIARSSGLVDQCRKAARLQRGITIRRRLDSEPKP